MEHNVFKNPVKSGFRVNPFTGSVSGKSFNQFGEQSSQGTSIINGFWGRETNRQLPSVQPNFEVENQSGAYLPIGIGGISDQSHLKYQQLMNFELQNEAERDFRIRNMFLNQMEKQSVISKENESIPTFTFHNDEGSIKSGSINRSSIHDVKANDSDGHQNNKETVNSNPAPPLTQTSPLRIGKNNF